MAGETKTLAGAAAGAPIYAPSPGGNIAVAYAETTLATTEMEATDKVDLFTLPQGALVVGGWVFVDDLDSGTTITMSLGDDVEAARFLNAATTARTGGVIDIGRTATLQAYVYPKPTKITLSFPAAGNQQGKVMVTLLYTVVAQG